jgi:hypothetical protein
LGFAEDADFLIFGFDIIRKILTMWLIAQSHGLLETFLRHVGGQV